MNQNKKIIISLGIFFSVILLSISILKISINILYPVNELSNSLKDSFKDIFGKAVKFDALRFKYNGDIVLQNFYLSNKNDFNDNINLIRCDEITIDTYLFDLIRKKVSFAGVYMVEPEITILKNYGKSYSEILIEEIIGGINQDKTKQFISSGFRFELTDSTLNLKETFKNSKSEINLYNLDLKLKFKNDSISYRSYGNIKDRERKSWFSSKYKVKGEISLNNKSSETDIELVNFDLTHLNNILNDRLSFRTLLAGSFSGKINISTDNEKIKCSGIAETSSVDLSYYEKDNSFPFLKNENIDTDFNFDLSKNFDRITVHKLEIDEGTINLSSSLDYVENDYITIQLKSNKIDLDELSESVLLFKNCSYSGNILFNGSCKYKLKDNILDSLNFNLEINKFNIIPLKENNEDLSNIRDGNASLTADKDKIILKTNFKTGNSDFNISYNGFISSWNPVKTSNNIEINSKNIDLDIVKKLSLNTVKKVYSLAYVDMFQNFDEQRNFLKEPEGVFINDNDISVKLSAEKLIIAGKAYLSNFNIDLSLIKGILKTNKFNIEGYNGIYSFDLYSTLHQEYPFFKLTGGAKEIDLNKISDDSGLNYSFGGKLSMDMNFETSAYRIGQVVENGKAGINITVKDGYINNVPIQNTLNDFLEKNNYKNVLNKKIDFYDFSISFMQSANSFYIRNFSLNSANIGFNCYGVYSEEEGLKIPLNLNIADEKTSERVPLPLEISGTLEAPCLNVKQKAKTKTKPESLCF